MMFFEIYLKTCLCQHFENCFCELFLSLWALLWQFDFSWLSWDLPRLLEKPHLVPKFDFVANNFVLHNNNKNLRRLWQIFYGELFVTSLGAGTPGTTWDWPLIRWTTATSASRTWTGAAAAAHAAAATARIWIPASYPGLGPTLEIKLKGQ